MRVGVMVRHFAEKGGIAVYTKALLDALFTLDHTTDYVLFYGSRASLGTYGHVANVREVHLPCVHKLWWDQVQVPLRARRLGLDLIFSPKMSLPLLLRLPKVLTIHGAEQFRFPQEYSRLDRLYVRFFLPRFARAADRVITPSEAGRDDLAETLHVPPEKLAVIPHGWKKVFGEPIAPERVAAVREKHGLTGDFILHVGLTWGAKNFDVFPAVLERVAQERAARDLPPVPLAHAGRRRDWAKSTRARSHHIRELGFIPDDELAALYRSATAFVFPSFYEGFGIPLVEAMASGCPVVTTRWGAMREVCGDAALLVDPHEPDEIAAAILELLDHPARRETLGRLGRDRAAAFSWERAARETLALFRNVATGDRGASVGGGTDDGGAKVMEAKGAPGPPAASEPAGSVRAEAVP